MACITLPDVTAPNNIFIGNYAASGERCAVIGCLLMVAGL